jgi:hypothetical protein
MKPFLTRFVTTVLVAVGLIASSYTLSAQTILTNTTLASAMSTSSGQSMTLTSATGFSASTVSAQNFAVIDREAVGIRAINTTTGVATITRGLFGTRATGHASGATVQYIPAGSAQLSAYDRSGACTTAGSSDPTQDASVQPVIVPATGSHFRCVSSKWERTDIDTSYSMLVTGFAQVAAASPSTGNATLTVVGGTGGAQSATTSNGAAGGAPSITGGVGGVGGTSSGTGGAGGAVSFIGGAGAGTVTGGAGGAATLGAGAGGNGTSAGGTGGALALYSGAVGTGGTGTSGGITIKSGGASGTTVVGTTTAGATTINSAGAAQTLTLFGSTTGKVTIADGTDTTKKLVIDPSGATTGTATTLAVSQAAAATLTLPGITGGLPVLLDCGSTGSGNQTCSPVAATTATKMYVGTSTLSGSAAIITFPTAFAATTSYQCVANDITTRANPVQMLSTSTNTATITNTTGATDVINWVCAGY